MSFLQSPENHRTCQPAEAIASLICLLLDCEPYDARLSLFPVEVGLHSAKLRDDCFNSLTEPRACQVLKEISSISSTCFCNDAICSSFPDTWSLSASSASCFDLCF